MGVPVSDRRIRIVHGISVSKIRVNTSPTRQENDFLANQKSDGASLEVVEVVVRYVTRAP